MRLAEIFGTSSDPLLYCLDPTCFAKYWWEKSIPILVLSSFLHHTYLACCRWATFARNPVDQFVYSRTARMRFSPAALVSRRFLRFSHWWWHSLIWSYMVRSWWPDGFRSFSFLHEENSGWVKTNWYPGFIQRGKFIQHSTASVFFVSESCSRWSI